MRDDVQQASVWSYIRPECKLLDRLVQSASSAFCA
jgi:hypothetical protein